MAFAILRTQKLKSGLAVRRSLVHAFREQETPNADPERTPDNSHIGANNVRQALECFNALLPDKVRSNAVLAVEYLVTGSPDAIHSKSREQQDAYFRDALAWLESRHGAGNVFYAGIHRDETTPHMYAYVVPIDERGKLNCRAFLGGAKALSEMQTDFAQQVGRQHGLERGVEQSKARHTTIRAYYARAAAELPKTPSIELPEPSLADRLNPIEYGRKAAESALHQVWPAMEAMQAQAREGRAAKQRVAALEAAALAAQQREAKLEERARVLERAVKQAALDTPEWGELKAAVLRNRPSEKTVNEPAQRLAKDWRSKNDLER